MIVKMSKVEIVGPREFLADTLGLVQDIGTLHIEPSPTGFIDEKRRHKVSSMLPDEKNLFQKVYLEDLQDRLIRLFSYLPQLPVRESFLSPQPIIDTISENLDRHLEYCCDLYQQREDLLNRLQDLNSYRSFLDSISSLIDELRSTPDLDYIGLIIKDDKGIDILKDSLDCLTEGTCELITVPGKDGTITGLIAVEKDKSKDIRNILTETRLPEFPLPESLKDLNFVQKVEFLKSQIQADEKALESINRHLANFTIRWGPLYLNTLAWINEQLSIIHASGLAFQTSMCFFVYGWLPTEKLESLRNGLQKKFAGKVLLEEISMHSEDMERVPVILKNPDYFKPFENFTRLLPLPAYTSFDPTPFIGLFFPVFFGMILGDAAYGILLLFLALLFVRIAKNKPLLVDALKILKTCSLYTIVFGLLYGEVLGDLGHRFLGLRPLLFERQHNILPMLYFSLAVGCAHVFLGLILGIISDIKKKTQKEAVVKYLHIMLMICIILLIVSFFGFFPELFTKPIIIAILILCPLLLFTGGLLAPLELIKSIGNIISYARIMAIGLSSVLLAVVANRLSGLTGDIILGLLVGGFIHLISIVIGVFSTSIHSLRLHYVEFFDKFIELGGRKFDPLAKKNKMLWKLTQQKKQGT
jgi:V/A-type H+-transporting ATPase subunit I